MKTYQITTPVESAYVHNLMVMDGHNVPCVSHAVSDDQGQIIAAFSTVYAPAVFMWVHSAQTPMVSFKVFCHIRQTMRDLGHARIILPTETTSPYYQYLERLGLTRLGAGELFIGEI